MSKKTKTKKASKNARTSKKTKASSKSSRSSKERYKVNFTNPKVKSVISRMEICEGRLSKASFLKTSSKDIYYQMLHSGYIKQKGDTIIATNKLRTYVANTHSTHFSSSCSMEHSKNMEKVLSFLPQSVIERRAYTTQSDLETRFKRDFKKNPSYNQRLDALKERYASSLASLVASHNGFHPTSDLERYQEALHFKNECSSLESKLSILENEPSLTPDFAVRLSRDELSLFMENLISHCEELTRDEERTLFTNAIEELRQLQSNDASFQEGEVTLCIEVITNAYHEREIFKHQNYSYITNQALIML